MIRYYFLLLVICNCNAASGAIQNNPASDLETAWVDSVMSRMTIDERIDQLFLIDGKAEPSRNLGGVLISTSDSGSAGPSNPEEIHNASMMIPPFVFASMKESPFGPDVEGTQGVSSATLLSAVNEPYLLYETGRYIGQESQRLGIHGLLMELVLLQGDEWRFSELYKGMEDEGLLSWKTLRIVDFNDLKVEDLHSASKPQLIWISAGYEFEHSVLRQWIGEDSLAAASLNSRCRDILLLKYSLGLFGGITSGKNPKVDPQLLMSEISKASVTVVRNDNNLIPIAHVENKKIACVEIGAKPNDDFLKYVRKYADADQFAISTNASVKDFAALWAKLANYDLIVEAVYGSEFTGLDSSQTGNFALFQQWLNTSGRCVTGWFGDPLLFKTVESLHDSPCLVAAWEPSYSTKLIPQVIFGGMDATGVLRFSLTENYPSDHGVILNSIGRFGYDNPESVGLSGQVLSKIESIVIDAIRARAIPGCQILVAKDGRIVYEKAFGYHTYDSTCQVSETDLYDLASLTKVSAGLPALMKLYEEGKLNLDATLSTYVPYFKKSELGNLTIREMLSHQAGLTAWIPFWKTTMTAKGRYKKKSIRVRESRKYKYELAPELYLKNDFKKVVYKQIRRSSVGEKKYLYSDLSFYLYPEIIEKLSGQQYIDYLSANFYKPLGATTIGYNPLDRFPLDKIIPTEYDSAFRRGQIHAKVHDEGAALMHGVSGHAGLFANATDLAKLWQMYSNYGEFGGRRYLKEETIREFSRCQYPENDNRRGLGFDRPMLQPTANGNTAVSVSQSSFGHSGFTGTYAWVDPEYNMVYIFLSNRVYTTRENVKLYNMNIRTNIQEVVYEAIRTGLVNE